MRKDVQHPSVNGKGVLAHAGSLLESRRVGGIVGIEDLPRGGSIKGTFSGVAGDETKRVIVIGSVGGIVPSINISLVYLVVLMPNPLYLWQMLRWRGRCSD